MNTKQPPEYINIKINKATRYRLRLLAARTGETMMALVDRLVEQEQQKLDKKEKAQ